MTDQTRQLIAELRDNRNDFPSYLHSLCKVAADEIERLAQYKARLEWLHDGGGKDAQNCEWGVFRVKWDAHGQPVEVWQTNSDFSDLDTEMRRSPVSPASAVKTNWP